jgi:hypothetical protein
MAGDGVSGEPLNFSLLYPLPQLLHRTRKIPAQRGPRKRYSKAQKRRVDKAFILAIAACCRVVTSPARPLLFPRFPRSPRFPARRAS